MFASCTAQSEHPVCTAAENKWYQWRGQSGQSGQYVFVALKRLYSDLLSALSGCVRGLVSPQSECFYALVYKKKVLPIFDFGVKLLPLF